jgi:hypothetical protein
MVGFPHPLTPFKIRDLGLSGSSVAATVGGIAQTSASGNVQPLKQSKATLYNLSVINTTNATAFVQLFNEQSGNGATVTFAVTAGVISSVTATPAAGGSGYPPSSTFNLPVTGGGGMGGFVQATTNSSGVVTAFAFLPGITSGGTGYSNTTGAATGGVVLGTTTPDYELQVAANEQVEANLPQKYGQGFSTALSIASTTVEGGSVASASGVIVTGNFA